MLLNIYRKCPVLYQIKAGIFSNKFILLQTFQNEI